MEKNEYGYDVHSEGYDPVHGSQRTVPEHKIIKIYAKNGEICIHGKAGDQERLEKLTIPVAIERANALNEIAKIKHDYKSDQVNIMNMLDSLITAIKEAKVQRDGIPYNSPRISMHGIDKNVG